MRMAYGQDHSGVGRIISCEKGEHSESPVAAAKTSIPTLRADVLVRERLLTLLDESVATLSDDQPVTLVCAPAGWGKTTMLASWARRRTERADVCVAWVSLDREDNDAFVLWSAIFHALRVGGAWLPSAPFTRLPAQPRRAPFLAAVSVAFEKLIKPVVLIVLVHLPRRPPHACHLAHRGWRSRSGSLGTAGTEDEGHCPELRPRDRGHAQADPGRHRSPVGSPLAGAYGYETCSFGGLVSTLEPVITRLMIENRDGKKRRAPSDPTQD